jgi:hypothetical protein
MTKSYSYQFSYYWKITWPNEEVFKRDAPNYKGFKQRVKRDCRTSTDSGVFLYINLRWVTTLGKMKSLFPSSTAIEVSSAEEFAEVKEQEDSRASSGKRTFKLKRKLEPTEEYSYCIRELDSKPVATGMTRRRKGVTKPSKDFEFESIEPENFVGPEEEDFDIVKKKVHFDEKIGNMLEPEYPIILEHPQAPVKNNSEASTSVHGDPFMEDELQEFIKDDKIKRMESNHPEVGLEFLTEESFIPYKKLSKLSSDDLTPKRIRNFGIENSINPMFWEFNDNQNFNLDPL